MEGLRVADANLTVYIHPSKSKSVSRTILRELGSLLFKFDESFDGVVLAYDVGIIDKNAKILPGIHPYFGVKLKAKLLLFSPKPDMLLEGKVVKITPESIHAVVLGFASAVIVDEDVREEFRYRNKNGKEVFRSKSDKGHVIKVGTVIRFTVKSMDEEILHISGALISDKTGNIRWLDKNLEETPMTERISEKRESKRQKEIHELPSSRAGTISMNDGKLSKKQKVRE